MNQHKKTNIYIVIFIKLAFIIELWNFLPCFAGAIPNAESTSRVSPRV